MAIGDVSGSARGTGARFNDGKPALELLPLRVFAEGLYRIDFDDAQQQAYAALQCLAAWQEDGGVGHLYDALKAIGSPWYEIAAVLEYGKRKYASWNWARGMPWSVCVGCAARHLEKMIGAEADDSESGLSHAGHAGCNLVFLIAYHTIYREGDDRPRTLLVT